LDPGLMERKQASEKTLRDAVAANAAFKETAGAWDRIAEAQKVIGANALRYNLLEVGNGLHSDLFSIARTLLRAADEKPKPNPEPDTKRKQATHRQNPNNEGRARVDAAHDQMIGLTR